MDVLKAHEKLMNIATMLNKIISKKEPDVLLQQTLKHMSKEMTSEMKNIAKSLSWEDKMVYARMKRSNSKSQEIKEVNECEKTTVPKKRQRLRLKRKAAPKSFLKEQTSNQMSSVWKRKLHHFIQKGVHPSSPAGCQLPGTPKQIGELLLEATKINKKTFLHGVKTLSMFSRFLLYKWRKKAKEQEQAKKTKSGKKARAVCLQCIPQSLCVTN